MFYAEVILLRLEGLRLPRRKWPAPIYGRIVVEDSPPNGSNFRRTIRKMTLYRRVGAAGSWHPGPILFDPYFLPSADGALMIAGIDLAAHNGAADISEHGQIWMCRTRAHPDEEREAVRKGTERQLPEA